MPALDRFIDALLESPQATWHAWAKRTAAAVSDQGIETPVRFPLFRRVLLPALADGVRREEPGCARWLESFHQLMSHVKESGLPAALASPYGLLREALRLDPYDARARRRLIDLFVGYFEYSLHELPTGVLYGTDGATAAQCEELSRDLDEFRVLVTAAGETEQFAGLIAECDFHFRTYAEYLRSTDVRPWGYAAFIERRDAC
jgi:hypothetical protein